ncbi:MAG: Type 4 prepilin-like protein leader peptide-processing enzyme [Berkelbacteria bacterium GW2011_GWB1_38_5]|uniref:Type 4 prepilin-like protein leader peptide-processing enzyme n=1 Tax=Berkelbacteria bacterium GW2011_GWB1_38_5 TaxID=1618336 RepID=A0A0G0ML74_9BACT|nr:MAG: Type 4 prepilin-like protein leader peptide-processing enzyme [Berkelbacteria bacterium GW2011_GWB1_38_5]
MSLTLIYILIILLGLAVGSFLNVVILRFDEIKTIINTRSHCVSCKKNLRWYDLIPFFSFVFLLGKCRYCKKNISPQYPLVEIGTGLIFGLLFWKFGFSWILIPYLLITCLLIVIFVYDILKLMISDFLVYLALGIWVVWILSQFLLNNYQISIILDSLYGGLVLGGFLGLIVIVSRQKWMGAGDIALGVLLGMMVGWPVVLVATFLAFVLGSFIGLFLIAVHKKKMKDQLPFAPFLITGMWLALLFGEQIINLYLGKFYN